MGVKGLWRLLLPIGRRISIETLTGQTVAVDASIWLTQFLKAMRDVETGRIAVAAHLIGFLRRLCRLRYHGIKAVLVFDGATPEIKKREVAQRRKRRDQFATLTNSSVQRLAKKLLTETLQRQQKQLADGLLLEKRNGSSVSATDGAFVAGFNPGAQAADASVVVSEKETALTASKGVNDTSVTVNINSNDSREGDVLRDMSPVPSPSHGINDNDEVNDWDLPLAVAAHEEAQEMEEQDRADSPVEYDDCLDIPEQGRRRRRQQSSKNSTSQVFDVDYVASIPAIERKDAIETAKRQLRLQSRKEFMPAAANPHDFSNVQVHNFLKSCRLNRDIRTMASRAAQKENRGRIGDVVASDRTTRVELIRETEGGTVVVDTDNQAVDKNNDPSLLSYGRRPLYLLQEKLKAKTLPAKRKVTGQKQWQDDDSDDDVLWSNPEMGLTNNKSSAVATASPTNLKKRRFVIDDENDSDSVQEVGVRTPNGHQYQRETIDLGDDEDEEKDDDFTKGGFLRATPRSMTDEGSPTKDFAHGPAREFNEGRQPSNSQRVDLLGAGASDEEVGFLNRDDTCSLSAKKPTYPESPSSVNKDERYAQELEDKALAEALQEEEDANANDASIDEGSRRHSNLITERPSPDDDDEMKAFGIERRQVDGRSIGNESYGAISPGLQVNQPSQTYKNASEGNDTSSDEESDEVDWEDGVAEHARTPSSEDVKYFSVAPQVEVDKSRGPFDAVHNFQDDFIQSPPRRSENVKKIHTSTPKKRPLEERLSSDRMSAETSAALQHAQATAANLTDWAGRAFRRAIKEAGGGVETKSQFSEPSEKISNPLAGKALHAERQFARQSSPRGTVQHAAEKTTTAMGDSSVSTRSCTGTSTKRNKPAFDASFLQENNEQWTAERNRRERDMDTVSDEMLEEVKQLLQLFGVPFVVAPAEAEAQCAALESLGLVQGIVTEDSDVFVFGGRTVYRHIFEEQKYAEVYKASDAEREMNLNRNAMVSLAMLLGGDYSEGVKGVGIVNAMELLDTFDVAGNLREGLQTFRKWLDGFDPDDALGLKSTERTVSTKEQDFHSKHKTARTRWVAPENFPAENVMKAYLDPVVDKSTERFSWGVPDIDSLVVFCNKHMGWSPEETQKLLDPIMDTIEAGRLRQTRIDSFMKYEDSIKFADVKSKRLREVLKSRIPRGDVA